MPHLRSSRRPLLGQSAGMSPEGASYQPPQLRGSSRRRSRALAQQEVECGAIERATRTVSNRAYLTAGYARALALRGLLQPVEHLLPVLLVVLAIGSILVACAALEIRLA